MNAVLATQGKRPIVITVFCVLGLIGIIPLAGIIVSGMYRNVGVWYLAYLITAGTVGLICLIGFWKMKKWAFYTYVSVAALNLIAMISTGWWATQPIIVSAITIAILGYNSKKLK